MQNGAGFVEHFGSVTQTVICHHPLDSDAEVGVSGDGTFLLLVRHDVGTGDAGMVVDADVNELPADLAGRLRLLANNRT